MIMSLRPVGYNANMNDSRQNMSRLQIRALINRLEKISADSPWAHRASGIRAALDRILSRTGPKELRGEENTRLLDLVEQGYTVLEAAAGQIPEGPLSRDQGT